MTSVEGQLILTDTAAPPLTTPFADRRAHTVTAEGGAPESIIDEGAHVYAATARAALPRLRHYLDEPSLLEGNVRAIRRAANPEAVNRRLSAASAVGMMLGHDPDVRGNELLSDCVRRSLIYWQLSLRYDGRPVYPRADTRHWHAVNADLVVRLLNETSTFHNVMLLDDVGRHLKWLAATPRHTPWVEAALISALADGALVVRDIELLRFGRSRLAALLRMQNEEGWFPEQGGADLGRLSCVVDSLARLHAHHEWKEVASPIRQAIRFLFSFMPPNGRIGGCVNSCETELLSPYGVEIMASTVPEAASLARAARLQSARCTHDNFGGWHDDLVVAMAPRIVAASTVAPSRLPVGAEWPWATNSHFHFPESGLSVHTTDSYHAVVASRRGGAVFVTWRSGAAPLADAGIVVACPHSTRRSICGWPQHGPRVSEKSVFCESILKPSGRSRKSELRHVGREAERPSSTDGGKDRDVSIKNTRGFLSRHSGLAHDTCTREIHFDQKTISIRDVVRCRLPCQAILCQLTHCGTENQLARVHEHPKAERAPIYVAGGRHVTIERSYRDGELVEFHTK